MEVLSQLTGEQASAPAFRFYRAQPGSAYEALNVGSRVNLTPTLNRVYYTPIWIPPNLTLSSVQVECNIGVANSFWRFGLLNHLNGLPGSFLIDYGQVSFSTSGVKVITSSLVLPAGGGLVYAASVAQGVAASIKAIDNVGHLPAGRNAAPGAAAQSGYRDSNSISGAFPGAASIAAVDVETQVPNVVLVAA